ncbi:MAG: hypothetical protein JWO79_1189 [Actinomycetia bacterium]|nr:hypothetical protein [Actinomycetes bacterium]
MSVQVSHPVGATGERTGEMNAIVAADPFGNSGVLGALVFRDGAHRTGKLSERDAHALVRAQESLARDHAYDGDFR